MGDESKGGWYSDRELFEMWQKSNQEILEKMGELKTDLRVTQEHIKTYNGLLEKFENVESRIVTLETNETERKTKRTNAPFWTTVVISIIALVGSFWPKGGAGH